jgi:hypothetical protein
MEAVNNWLEKRRKQARASGQVMVKGSKTISDVAQEQEMCSDQGRAKSKQQDSAQHKEWLEKIEADITSLLAAVQGFTPLAAMPCSSPFLLKPSLNDSNLAICLVGQTAPLNTLLEQEGIREVVSRSTVEMVQNEVVQLAVRRNHATKQSKEVNLQTSSEGSSRLFTASASMDFDEAVTEAVWQWELHDVKVLPKPIRPVAVAIRKRAQKVGERLMALTHARDTISQAHSGGHLAPSKAIKAFEAVAKLSSVSALLDDLASEINAAEAKASEELAAVNDKERLKKEKEEEKERLKKEKEEEKERLKEEAASAKIAKKTGFKDKQELNKTANKFKSFFKASAPSTNDPNLTKRTPNEAFPISSGITPCQPSFSKRMQIGLDDVMDKAFASKCLEGDTEEKWHSFIDRIRSARQERKLKRPTSLGLPPVWARRPGAVEAAAERLQSVIDSGTNPAAVKTWRRKFIWFPADSARPPYYGSWPAPGKEVRPRRPWGRDETLDYDVMSDIDWEEEPEGSSLSKADSEDEVVAEDDGFGGGDDDSFMVADGYLSADEGVELEEEDGMAVDSEFGMPGDVTDGFAPISEGASSALRKQAFGALLLQMERARRAGKPLIVLRDEPATQLAGCIQGDQSLLQALAMEAILPGAKFLAPKVDDLMITKGSGQMDKETDKGKGKDDPSGKSRKDVLEELLPALALYIQNNAILKKPQLMEGFIQAQNHAERKIPKKWVNEKISELAERSGGKWKLRPKGETPANPTIPNNQRLLVGMSGVLDKVIRVPEVVDGTGDNFWLEVLSRIEEVDQSEAVSSIMTSLQGVFQKQNLAKCARSIPAFIVSAMVLVAERILRLGPVEKDLENGVEESRPLAWQVLGWLREIVDSIIETSTDSTELDDKSLSQRAWGDSRCGPRGASLDELCREPILASVLCATIDDSNLPLAVLEDLCIMITKLSTSSQWKECTGSGDWVQVAKVLKEKETGMDTVKRVHAALEVLPKC